MKLSQIATTIILTVGCILIFPGLSDANISNQGSDAVRVEVTKEDGSIERLTVYPGQTSPMPFNATDITVSALTYIRGDEDINVIITEEDGKEVAITDLGGTFKLNQEKAKQNAGPLQKGSAVNTGNINVNLEGIRKDGSRFTRSLILGREVSLPIETDQVRVKALRKPRSDEIINVEVMMPDGKSKTITRDGGIVKMKKPRQLSLGG